MNNSSNNNSDSPNPIEVLEDMLGDELPWESISDVKDFPVETFEELQQNVKDRKLELGIDFTISNKLAFQSLYGKMYGVSMATLGYLPLYLSGSFILLSITLSKWVLLIGIPFVFLGDYLGNPYNPYNNIFVLSSIFIVSVTLLIANHFYVAAAILSAFVTYGSKQFIYKYNQSKLKDIALSSEHVLLHLYHDGLLTLRDSETGETTYHMEGMRRKYGIDSEED
ncbi:MAG: hypothetical protein ABEI53_02690 [Candidatus Magasanikbacteria bacterium]